MDSHAGLPFWMILAGPGLGLVVVTMLRWVPRGARLVVLRRGAVVRLHGPGPAWRWPWVEETATEPEELPGTPVAVRARTRDGRRVFVGLTADLRTLPPAVGQRYRDPADAAEEAVTEVVSEALAGIDVHELPEGLVARVATLRGEADRTTRPQGVATATLRVEQMDVILDLHDDLVGGLVGAAGGPD